jgi:Fic family protein
MHAILLAGVRHDRGQYKNPGRFRKTVAYIGAENIADARYVAPPADHIETAMASLEKYIHGKTAYHPTLIRIASIHYQFEAIHPFEDGNGRIGRLLISLLLAAWGILPQPLLYLSAYFDQHLDDYREKLWRVSAKQDWIGWTRFFLQGVLEEARDASNRAKRILELREEYRRQLQKSQRSSSILLLVDCLFKRPFVTVQMAADEMGVTYNSGKKAVEKLMDARILSEYPDQHWNRIYCAKPILEILK